MKYRDPETGEFKELYTKAADTLPVGTVVDFDGDEVPAGWEAVINEKPIELLAENIENNDTDILVNLSKSVNNYKFICIIGQGYSWESMLTIPVEILKISGANRFYSAKIADNYGIACIYRNETQLTINIGTALTQKGKVYGLK